MAQLKRKLNYERIKVHVDYVELIKDLLAALKNEQIFPEHLKVDYLQETRNKFLNLELEEDDVECCWVKIPYEQKETIEQVSMFLSQKLISESILQYDFLLNIQTEWERETRKILNPEEYLENPDEQTEDYLEVDDETYESYYDESYHEDYEYEEEYREDPNNTKNSDILVEIQELSPNLKLTNCQQNALIALHKFINSDEKYFRLTGYAGSGKSFLIAQFLKWLRKNKFSFIGAAPTNKALKNMAALATLAGVYEITTHTVAQLIGQQPVFNEKLAKEEFIAGQKQNKISLSQYDIILCDEFSMLSENNFDYLNAEALLSDVKIVFIGDPAQLPPVGATEPIVASSDLITSSAELTEIVRYDGEIGQVAEQIRSEPKWNSRVYPFLTTADETIVRLPRQKWLNRASGYFKDWADVKFLVFTNRSAIGLNNFVREQLWGKDCPPFCIGDRLIAKTPVFRGEKFTPPKDWQIKINNSEECKIIDDFTIKVHEENKTQEGRLKYYSVPVESDDGTEMNLKILMPESEKKKKQILENYKNDKQWQSFQALNKTFDNVPFAYALTTHKAQGSSIDYVFLDAKDLNRCPERQKILYTALTRAKKKAFITLE